MKEGPRRNIRQITPFLHVPDLEAAILFFDLVGFEVRFRQSNYAYLEREGAAVRLLESVKADGTAFEPHRGFAYYVDVSDVDAIVAETKPKLVAAGVVFSGPVNQPYSQREFMIRAPDGNLLVFGQPLDAS